MIVNVGGSPPCSIHGWIKALNWCIVTLGLMVIVMHGTWIVKKKNFHSNIKSCVALGLLREREREREKASIQIRLKGDGNT